MTDLPGYQDRMIKAVESIAKSLETMAANPPQPVVIGMGDLIEGDGFQDRAGRTEKEGPPPPTDGWLDPEPERETPPPTKGAEAVDWTGGKGR